MGKEIYIIFRLCFCFCLFSEKNTLWISFNYNRYMLTLNLIQIYKYLYKWHLDWSFLKKKNHTSAGNKKAKKKGKEKPLWPPRHIKNKTHKYFIAAYINNSSISIHNLHKQTFFNIKRTFLLKYLLLILQVNTLSFYTICNYQIYQCWNIKLNIWWLGIL